MDGAGHIFRWRMGRFGLGISPVASSLKLNRKHGRHNRRGCQTSPSASRSGLVDQELCIVYSKQGSGYETPAFISDHDGREEHDGAGGSLDAVAEAERRV